MTNEKDDNTTSEEEVNINDSADMSSLENPKTLSKPKKKKG